MAAAAKPRWADILDSSQENIAESQPVPISQSSYHGQAAAADSVLADMLDVACVQTQNSPCSSIEEEPDAGAPATEAAGGEEPGAAAAVPDADEPPPGAGAGGGLTPMSQRLQAWRPKPRASGVAVAGEKTSAGALQPACRAPVVALTPFTPTRRRPKQKYEMRMMASSTPGRKRPRSGAFAKSALLESNGPPEASPEEWERRHERRKAAVSAIKSKPEYEYMEGLRESGSITGEAVPLTPDPDDSTVSKRQWEASVMHWRSKLRNLPSAV